MPISSSVRHTTFKRRTINVDCVIKFKLPIYLRVHQKKIHKSEIEQELLSNGSEEPLNFKWWLRFEILDRIAAVKSQRLHLMVSKMIIRRLLILRRVKLFIALNATTHCKLCILSYKISSGFLQHKFRIHRTEQAVFQRIIWEEGFSIWL